ncbi:4'-phosphopantetheinyl transferase family protein [Gordonia alkanivorans]|uniref:4'-phosphopantetheinyl transferase n=1 Tax=Gordonia alkanivorans CGMCC 6845 TaxID=1423140 RepID=W9DHK6_9ACTN|nr:4'-phosphopantetheinyl transferase [Gordonia alkanivorans]AZZ81969.1 4'-phosphopantetheinyl transferase [Gordonia alkanivorans]ETA07972.1 4'-phosphopantetheinyl transferase [Gordonia alkanivorans CGMCC 6845]MDH3009714.1 4'-phosphopantetheinyl transferase [Gordonia alkanivorans]MDH3048307.1 4'-phosphopantetheinyl transferase [Gordonia alkanivorans]
MIEQLLPSGVASAEAFDDPPGLIAMPAEQALIGKAVEKRRREFTTVRHCARQALGQLGYDPVPILKGDKGAPIWPAGIVGSLTHCDGYRAAIVAHAMGVRSLGMDAEPHDALPDGVLEHTSLPAEREVLATRPAGLHWDRLLFCAKEATYKAWFPITKRWLGFEDALITFEQTADTSGTFVSRILIDPAASDGGAPVIEFHGRWLVERGIITTTIAMV